MKALYLFLIFLVPSLSFAQWTTSGTHIYNNNSGNVGIGTTSPQKVLHVHGASGEVMRLSSSPSYLAGAGPEIGFWNSSYEKLASVSGVFSQNDQGNYGNLIFKTRTSDAAGVETKMTILHNGNVGIGTTSPATPLHIYSNSSNFGVWSNIQIPMVVISPGSTEAMRGTASRYAGSSFGVIGEAGTGVGDAAAIYGRTLSGSGGVSVAGYFNGDLTYTGSFGKASDIKFKENINDLSSGLSFIKKLKPKEYTYKKIEGYNFPMEKEVGLIAQEVKEILPNIVKLASNVMAKDQSDKPDRYLSVDYVALVPFLVKAIQEQQTVIDKHQSILNSIFSIDGYDSLEVSVSGQFSVPYIKSVSPNPAQTQVTIELAIPDQSKSAILVLLDKNGKPIFNTVIDSNKSNDKS